MTFAQTSQSPIAEYLAVQNALLRKARHLYFGRIGYVTQPKPDRRGEPFVRAEVLDSRLGVCIPAYSQWRRTELFLFR